MAAENCGDEAESVPLNRMQQEILRRQDLLGSRIYVIGNVAWLDGPMDEVLLERAVRDVAGAEATMRAYVRKQGGEAQWVVAPDPPVSVQRVDAPAAPSEAAATARAFAARLRDAGIDPYAAPLWRFALLRLGERRHAWITYFHHVLVDGYGIHLAWQRLRARYAGLLEGERAPLPPRPLRPAADPQAAHEAAIEKARAYWERVFPPAPARRFPRLPAGVDDVLLRLVECRWSIAWERWERFEALAASLGLWPAQAAIGLLAWQLARSAGMKDLVLGVPLHERTSAAELGALDLHFRTLPLRIAAAAGTPFSALAQALAAEFRHAFFNRHYPLGPLLAQQPARAGIAGMSYDLTVSVETFDYGGAFGEAACRVESWGGHPAVSPVFAYVRQRGPQAGVEVDVVIDPRAPAAVLGGAFSAPALDACLGAALGEAEAP